MRFDGCNTCAMTLAEYMKLRGLSDEALGRKVGCNRVHILRIRRGEKNPSATLLLRLQDATGLPSSAFVVTAERAA